MIALLTLALATARLDWFDYRGRNPDGAIAKTGEFRRPVPPGFYSDPSVLRVGRDYYLVTTTFSYFRALAGLYAHSGGEAK